MIQPNYSKNKKKQNIITQTKKQNKMTQTSLKVMYSNIDQLTTIKKKELEQLMTQTKHHLIALCEVKPKNGQIRLLQEYCLNGYEIVNHTNLDKNKGRGIVILAHESISHLTSEISLKTDFEELSIIEVRLSGKSNLMFGCFYRSPTSTFVSDKNNDDLNNLLRSISKDKKYSHKCFVGDFNYNSINWVNWSSPHNEDSKEEKFLDALRDSYLFQHIRNPTRSRGNDVPSIIDLLLTNEENQVFNLEHLSPIGKSDHCIISFMFQYSIDLKTPTYRFKYELGDFAAMRESLRNNNNFKNLAITTNQTQVNDLWKEFKDTVLHNRNMFVPHKKISNSLWKESMPFSESL